MKDKDRISSILNALALSARSSDDTSDAYPDDETFAAFLDGTLDEAEAERFRAHLAEKPEAWLAYQALKETEAIEGPPVPAHLIQAAKDLVKARASAGAGAARLVVKLLKGALELLEKKDLEIDARMEIAAEPVRSSGTPGAEKAQERIDIASTIEGIEGISLQKVEPSDVRITLTPARGAENRTLRVDLMLDETLIQSWPLEGETLSLEPVTAGCYTLRVFEHDDRCGEVTIEIK